MLTHVVMMNLQDPAADGARIAELLNALRGKVPTLRSMSAGTDVIRADRSWDLALVSTFDDVDGLEAYRTHPEHVAVLTQIQAAATQIAAVDFTT